MDVDVAAGTPEQVLQDLVDTIHEQIRWNRNAHGDIILSYETKIYHLSTEGIGFTAHDFLKPPDPH